MLAEQHKDWQSNELRWPCWCQKSPQADKTSGSNKRAAPTFSRWINEGESSKAGDKWHKTIYDSFSIILLYHQIIYFFRHYVFRAYRCPGSPWRNSKMQSCTWNFDRSTCCSLICKSCDIFYLGYSDKKKERPGKISQLSLLTPTSSLPSLPKKCPAEMPCWNHPRLGAAPALCEAELDGVASTVAVCSFQELWEKKLQKSGAQPVLWKNVCSFKNLAMFPTQTNHLLDFQAILKAMDLRLP